MKDDATLFGEINEWALTNDKSPPDLDKHQPLIDSLLALGIQVPCAPPLTKALVVGGRACLIEQEVLSAVGFQGQIISVDSSPPQAQPKLGTTFLHLPGRFPDEVALSALPEVSTLVCLATSRYFPDAFETYLQLVTRVRTGGLVIIDFLHLPLIPRASINAFREWLFATWQVEGESALIGIHDLAKLSRVLGSLLADTVVSLDSDRPELGFARGTIRAQQMIYQSVFPFWFKEGASDSDLISQIVWNLLLRSMEGTEQRIRAFAEECNINVARILALSPNTNVLIGTIK